MTTTSWMRATALGCLAAALIAGGFAPVVPHDLTPYFGSASGVFTGLAALFTHPPGSPSEAPAAAPAKDPTV
jgi:hypothetical protein